VDSIVKQFCLNLIQISGQIFHQSINLKYLSKEFYRLIFAAPGRNAHAKHGTAFRVANILTVPVSDCTSDGRFGRYFSSKAMQMGVRTF
jgi:hypothetical protein